MFDRLSKAWLAVSAAVVAGLAMVSQASLGAIAALPDPALTTAIGTADTGIPGLMADVESFYGSNLLPFVLTLAGVGLIIFFIWRAVNASKRT